MEPLKVTIGYTTFEAGGRDSEGYIWLASGDIGRYDETKREWLRYTTTQQLGFQSHVSLVYEDRLGRIWIGCLKGDVAVYDKKANSWRAFKLKDHVAAGDLLADRYGFLGLDSIYQDKTGKMFFGTWRGLLTLSEPELSLGVRLVGQSDQDTTHRTTHLLNEWKIYTSKNSPLRGDHVTSILEDQSGAVWIGTNEAIFVLE
jgi:ligand-binding sensor domain-containing protein